MTETSKILTKLRWPRIAALGVLMALSVASCAEFRNDADARVDADIRHPIKVTSRFVTLPVNVPAGATELDAAETALVSDFIDGFVRTGGRTMEIAVPSSAGDDGSAMARAAVVHAIALRRGARLSEINIRLTDISDQGPVVVSYERFEATPPPCGPTAKNMAFDPKNLRHDTYGCVTQYNLAISLSNPRDYLRAQDESPHDTASRDTVTRSYRAGTSTGKADGFDPASASGF